MTKQKTDHNDVISLCREFMIEANRRTGGEIFKYYPARDVTKRPPELAIEIVKEFFQAHNFHNLFPDPKTQNSIGYIAQLNSGVDFGNVKKALKEEGLDGMMQVIDLSVYTYHNFSKTRQNVILEMLSSARALAPSTLRLA